MSEQPQHEIDAALMREYLDSRAEDQRQLGQLEGATTRLASEVGGLREAMTTYESEISKVRESSVSKDDAFEARKQMLENLVQLRLRIRRRTNRLFAIAMLVLFAAIGVGVYVFHAQAEEHHSACLSRNRAARAALPFYDREIANLNDHHSDPAVIDVLKVARVSAQHSIVKC